MSEQQNATELKPIRREAQDIPIDLIKINDDDNCRLSPSEEGIKELADQIKEDGQTTPILVFKNADNTFTLIAGSRRVKAIRLNQEELGIPQVVLAIVKKKLSDVDIISINLCENIQREALSCIEEARGVKRLSNAGLTQTEIAKKIGKSQAWVSQRVILSSLNYGLQMKIHAGEITLVDGLKLANQTREEQKETSDSIDAAKAEVLPIVEPVPVVNEEGDVVGVTMPSTELTPEQKKVATQVAKARAREIARQTPNPNARKKEAPATVIEEKGRPDADEILEVVNRAIKSTKVDDDTKTVLKVLALYVEGTIRDEDDFIISFNEAVLSVKPEENVFSAGAVA